MKDELDMVGKLSDSELLQERFRLKSISPDDGKYGYKADPLREYLSEEAQWLACAKVQEVLLETGVEFGRGSEDNVREMRKAMKKINPLNMKLIEKHVTHHDQLAVIEEIGRHVSPETKVLLHPGTTSYDILDTARSHLYKRAWFEVMKPEVYEVIGKLCDLGEIYIDTVQVGRTHLQDTSPIVFGSVLAKYAARLAERTEKCDIAFSDLRGKVSGIVGTGAGIEMIFGEQAEEFEGRALEKLDLKPDKTATQIVQKERLADAAHSIVTLDAVLADLAGDMRILYSSPIQEVTSRDAAKRLGGSSTDAGKNNPINWENIEGKYAVVESGMRVVYDLIRTDLQRDLRGSVQARYQPFLMMAETYESFCRASKALDKLSVNEDKMLDNLKYVREHPTEAMVTILKGENFIHPEYGLPHDFVKKMAQKSKGENKKLMDVCFEDDIFTKKFNSLSEDKKRILSGEIENYIGFDKKRAKENIEYARSVM